MNLEQLTLSSVVSHVNLQVLPGSEEAQKMTVGSGRKLLELLKLSGQGGVCLKTLLEYLVYRGGVPFDNILSEMEREGYEVGAFSIPACAVGAPHRRERIFIVGYSGKCRLSGKPRRGTGEKLEDRYSQLEKGFMADTKNPDRWRTDGEENKRRRNQEVGRCNIARSGVEYGTTQPRMGRVSYGFSAGMDRHSWPAGQWPTPTICGNYNRKGASKTSGDGLHTAVMQWPAGPGEQHEWEPPRIAKGVKNRVARLKALGNAVVPAQVYPILRAIAEIEGMEAEV